MLVCELDAEHGSGEDGSDFTFGFDYFFNCHKFRHCRRLAGGAKGAARAGSAGCGCFQEALRVGPRPVEGRAASSVPAKKQGGIKKNPEKHLSFSCIPPIFRREMAIGGAGWPRDGEPCGGIWDSNCSREPYEKNREL